MKDLLGGKGANLAEMNNLGIPVPPGFTISTRACNLFVERGHRMPTGLDKEVAAAGFSAYNDWILDDFQAADPSL